MKVLIMAGGSGERFWPLSTKSKPKQFLSLVTNNSMIRETVNRIMKIASINDIFIATNSIQVNGIINEIPELAIENIIVEPQFKDTAAAIAYGSAYISKFESNPTILVLASDHLIMNEKDFLEDVKTAVENVEDKILTFGVLPTKPETGYGYIKLGDFITSDSKLKKAEKFLEKPNYKKALEYVDSGEYVWNSGMFVFKYNTIMNELRKYIRNHYDVIEKMKNSIDNFSGFELANKTNKFFDEFERISIDFAIMEKSDIVYCLPINVGWNDIGGFNSLADILPKDLCNNITKDCKYVYIDSKDNIVISDSKESLISTIGISNTIIIQSRNGLLICNRLEAQRIKELLRKINEVKR